ncbi:MAG: hypothetical protein QOD60_279 [Solirubrobacterales bacterium]|jgi:hypothetical protein|nr:hypothetical protein [Solirubrobacterales bacterium]
MPERLRLTQTGPLTLKQFAAFVARASDEELAELMADSATRKPILDFLYEQSVAMLRAEQPLDFDGEVIHWHVTGAPKGGCDSFQLLIEGGVALPSRCLTRLPRCSFETGPVELLRRVGGQATMMGLMSEGRAVVSGDLLFAARVEELFRRKTFG